MRNTESSVKFAWLRQLTLHTGSVNFARLFDSFHVPCTLYC